MKLTKAIFIVLFITSLSLSTPNLHALKGQKSAIAIPIADFSVSQDVFTIRTLTGHSSEVWDVEFSPDGSLLASASSDNSILVWNVTTGIIQHNLTGHMNSVFTIAFHPTKPILASGSFDQSILLWNLTTGGLIFNLTGHTSSIWSLEFDPSGSYLASGSGDSTVRIWDVNTFTSLTNLTGHTESVRSVAFHPNGSLLASGSYDDSIILWNMSSGSLNSVVTNTSDNILSLSFNPLGTELVSGSQDNKIKFWDMNNIGSEIRAGYELDDWVRTIAYSFNGYYLASGLENGKINIWDETSNQLVTNLTGHSQSIRNLDFHPTEPILVSASGDNTIRLWNLTDLDQDGLPDIWEIMNGLSPRDGNDGDLDYDNDGLSNFNEFLFGTDPQLKDSDADTIPDEYEFNNGLNGTKDDASDDKDQDGMPNLYEYQNNLQASVNDSMGDLDGDGMSNLFEYVNGLLAGVDDSQGDLDNDGLPNYYEFMYGLNIRVNDAEEDLDSDGLSNISEYFHGTDPTNPDSDNDSFNDNFEIIFGTNPTNFYSNPFLAVVTVLAILSTIIIVIFTIFSNRFLIKSKSIKVGTDIQSRIKKIPDFFRSKTRTTWMQDLKMGKAIPIDMLTSDLGVNQLKLPTAVKTSLGSKDLLGKALVLRSDMMLLEPLPPKNTNCQICMSEIKATKYVQCVDCKRFVCIDDFVDLLAIDHSQCPNCSGKLIMFSFSCKACGLDFASVSEITGKSGCPLCGYSLIDQAKLIANVTKGIVPSKIVEKMQDINELDSEKSHKSKPK